ncbi:hypothetical protein LTR37_007889 [Vermiconidia calcicola]|uniref:Uncharacterized protein n=1 Tax=Vermiconidia calcicola TaxID=1690605 RepID=A0ACC3NCA5_9PEZI|nr:hypothetical protein LTR37_007889 [Vermiconidia calcicola]
MDRPAFDARKLYNQEEFSDVLVKFGDSQVYCHKIILCNASEVFKEHFKALGEASDQPRLGHAAEGQAMEGPPVQTAREVVKLQDRPEAVEALLKAIYDHEYTGSIALGPWEDLRYHMDVYAVAHKYRIRCLALVAWTAAKNRVHAINVSGDCDIDKAVEHITWAVKHKTCCPEFRVLMKLLVREHRTALWAKPAFRVLLEDKRGRAFADDLAWDILLDGVHACSRASSA